MRERVYRIVADVLEMPMAALRDELGPDDLPAWDSVRHLQLVTALEDELGIELEPEEQEGLRCVGDFVRVALARVGG